MEETALPDDLILEVLAHVPDVAVLFRCAMACKRWAGLIADRSFLRRRWPDLASHMSFLVGFFVQRRPKNRLLDPYSPPVFIPAPHSMMLGHGLRLSPASEDVLRSAMPLVARGGLLLVRLAPLDFFGTLCLAVCDLLAGTCDVLPPLQCDNESMSYCILTGKECPSSGGQTPQLPAPVYSTFFKVLAIGVVRTSYGRNMEYKLHMFSSAEPGWAIPTKLAAPGLCPTLQHCAAVCSRGMPHWLCGDWLLRFPSSILTITDTGPDDGHASLVELSFPAIQPTPKSCHMATLDGSLSLFCMYTKEDPRLEILTWTDKTHWCRTRVVQLQHLGKRLVDVAFHMWSGEKSGTLLVMDSSLCYYIANLETGQMEKLPIQFSDKVGYVIPIEIDWPCLFMSRLVRLVDNCSVL